MNPCGGGASSPQYFYNFTSYRNAVNGIFTKLGGDLHHINPVLIENGAEEVRATLMWGSGSVTQLSNCFSIAAFLA